MGSLNARLLGSLSLLLILFFGLTIAALDSVFRNTGKRAVRDVLDIHLIALLSVAEPDERGGFAMPQDLPEARFTNPGSGLYAEILDGGGRLLWRSPSAIGLGFDFGSIPSTGERLFQDLTLADETPVLALSMGIEWEFDDETSTNFVISVGESLESYHAQVERFRTRLFGWFGMLAALLLISQAVLLRWLTKPLKRMESEIRDIETGNRAELDGEFPTELQGVARNMNTLINSERRRRERYQNTLGNLAHSLKTPLAVIRSHMETSRPEQINPEAVQRQVDQMNEIIGYQLKSAAASGGGSLGAAPVSVREVVADVCGAMTKVYADKTAECAVDTSEDALYYGDKGELTEVIGNLIDNAYKWCRSRVSVFAQADGDASAHRRGFVLVVEDDGPGIDDPDVDRVVNRGVRADERVDGHGIGLAIVREIAEINRGTLTIQRSELGGARMEVRIPPP